METLLSKFPNVKTPEQATRVLASQIEITPQIQKAIELAKKAHQHQFRKSGEPYIIHPLLVASIVANIVSEASMVVSALLHDVVEDTSTTIEEIEAQYGDDVAHLVEGLTKITELRDEKLLASHETSTITKSALSFRKMLIASTKDVRVLIVKLCDRLHNMLTLDAMSEEKQNRIAEETMVVYAPIAHRLGVSSVKNRLEDLSFKYLFRDEYLRLDHYLSSHNENFSEQLNSFISNIENLMMQEGFSKDTFTIFGRVKHKYSIYLKLQRKGIAIEEVLDLLAVRILVREPLDCYNILGLIHLNFKPLMSRFKDYISVPKENGYETIHTTVFSNRSLFEVQIRTYDMHQTAEFGVAAHWKYKKGGHSINLDWLDHLSDQSENVEAFMDLASKDLFSEDITVFSPLGDAFTLPRGSVALDFAYAVHTDVGMFAKAAYVNKLKVPLLTELSNGDLIEIRTSETTAIRCSWADAVKTSKARHALLHYSTVHHQEVDANIVINILQTLVSKNASEVQKWLETTEYSQSYFKAASDWKILHQIVALFTQEHSAHSIMPSMLQRNKSNIKSQKLGNFIFYTNKNISDVNFDYCCHPKKGDDIVAFIKGNQVEIHHKMCDMIQQRIQYNDKMVLGQWNDERVYKYHLTVSLLNNQGALAKFLLSLAKIDIDIISIELGNKNNDEIQYCTLLFETKQNNYKWLNQKIAIAAHIVEFVRSDDIYQK